MPAATPIDRSAGSSKISSCSDYSECSNHSANTALTDHSGRPSIQQYDLSGNPYEKDSWDVPQYPSHDCVDQRASRETYASSVSSEGLDRDQNLPPYNLPHNGYETIATKSLAASPKEFAEYFPSTRKLCIGHDDSTLDGNMNLRVGTKARTYDGKQDVDLTLFHLRMHDLKRREFSLRRYCRDSGREVCHSSRKSSAKRPGLQRSVSNALSNFRSKSDTKTATITRLKRQDSGYDTMHEEAVDEVEIPSWKGSNDERLSRDTVLLEFSNYAHLEIKRRGPKASGKFDFEYWGTKYAWKRTALASGNFKEISYHLCNIKTSASLAHIVPIPQSNLEIDEEIAKGGWVPPCVMTLEKSVINSPLDLADVIVASGLITLVDDCIKNRWHHKSRVQMSVPMLIKSPMRLTREHVGPRRLMDEVFHRREKTSLQRPAHLRQASC